MRSASAQENTGLQFQPPPKEQNYGATAVRVRRGALVPVSRSSPAKRHYLITAVLCYGNLINFMDWFIVPGEIWFSPSKEIEISQSFTLQLQMFPKVKTCFMSF